MEQKQHNEISLNLLFGIRAELITLRHFLIVFVSTERKKDWKEVMSLYTKTKNDLYEKIKKDYMELDDDDIFYQ
jgi:hypothetical protein